MTVREPVNLNPADQENTPQSPSEDAQDPSLLLVQFVNLSVSNSDDLPSRGHVDGYVTG